MRFMKRWWMSLLALLARLRAKAVQMATNLRSRYDLWVEREQAKNDRLRKKGDQEWQEVKRLWRQAKQDRDR